MDASVPDRTATATGSPVARLVEGVLEQSAGPRPVAGVDWPSRAFVTAVEGPKERGKPAAGRPRVAVIAVAGGLCALLVVGVTVWPVLANAVRHASHPVAATSQQVQRPAGSPSTVPNPGGVQAPSAAQDQTLGAPVTGGVPPSTGGAPYNPGGVSPLVAAAPLTQQAPVVPSQQQPAVQQQSAPAVQQSTPAPAVQPAAATVQNTPPGSRIVGGNQSGSGWNYPGKGGYPNFTGAMAWTTNSSATATWSTNGLTSSNITVQVWIPNTMAGAEVSYTVIGTTTSAPVKIIQERVSGWQTLVTSFASSGTITVKMSYVTAGSPGATPDPNCINGTSCTAMASAQVQFSWS